jgi:hypothetical protein
MLGLPGTRCVPKDERGVARSNARINKLRHAAALNPSQPFLNIKRTPFSLRLVE